MRLATIASICAVVSCFLGLQPAYACTCMGPRTVEEAVANSSAVFVGKVTKIYRPLLSRLGIWRTYGHRVEFEITTRWKGRVTKTIVVTTRLSGEGCGYPFEENKEYLVYVVDEPADIQTGICTGTRDAAGAEREIEEVNRLFEERSKGPERPVRLLHYPHDPVGAFFAGSCPWGKNTIAAELRQ